MLDGPKAHALIQQKRWLDAHDVLAEHLQKHPGAIEARVALARVQLALGNPDAALRLLTHCVEQGITNLSINGLLWRARVRAAQTSAQAA